MSITKGAAILSLVFLLMGPAGAAAEPSRLEVVVTNVQNTRGVVRVGVCPKQTFLEKDCPYEANSPAKKGETTIILSGIPPGTYAAQVFHDENENHEVDRSLVGIPTEGVGFSNNPSFTFAPPDYADAAFNVGPGDGRITIRLRHYE